mmetsp:Transcript_38779/g.82393  ORF Transcript_38779/g.82393 Transcript_38779/m.82393 type:complete len:418 (-) Transcript_38779:2322-3575(-)
MLSRTLQNCGHISHNLWHRTRAGELAQCRLQLRRLACPQRPDEPLPQVHPLLAGGRKLFVAKQELHTDLVANLLGGCEVHQGLQRADIVMLQCRHPTSTPNLLVSPSFAADFDELYEGINIAHRDADWVSLSIFIAWRPRLDRGNPRLEGGILLVCIVAREEVVGNLAHRLISTLVQVVAVAAASCTDEGQELARQCGQQLRRFLIHGLWCQSLFICFCCCIRFLQECVPSLQCSLLRPQFVILESSDAVVPDKTMLHLVLLGSDRLKQLPERLQCGLEVLGLNLHNESRDGSIVRGLRDLVPNLAQGPIEVVRASQKAQIIAGLKFADGIADLFVQLIDLRKSTDRFQVQFILQALHHVKPLWKRFLQELWDICELCWQTLHEIKDAWGILEFEVLEHLGADTIQRSAIIFGHRAQ